MSFVKQNWLVLFSLAISIIGISIFNINRDLAFKDLTMAWNIGHYAVNYTDFGFVKRGLVGSLYNLINGSFSQESLLLFQSLFILFLILITHFFFSKLNLKKSFIYILFIVSPATFLQFSSDLGRFDPILVSIFMLSVIYRSSPVLFVIFSIFGILTHEIYTFALLPSAFILYLSERVKLVSLKEIIVESIKSNILYILITLILVVVLLGSYEPGYEQIIKVFSNSELPPAYVEYHTKGMTGWPLEIWTTPLLDSFIFTSQKLTLSLSTIYMVFVYLFILIYFHLIGVNFKKPRYYLILLSSFPMFLLGTDWGRWLAFIYISIFVIFIVTERDKAGRISNKYLLLFSLYGPLGVGGSLSPLFSKAYKFIMLIM